MTTDDTFEIRKELGVFGTQSGRIFINMIINRKEWFVTMYAFYPSDRRLKAPIIKLYQSDLSALSIFLKTMLGKINELKGTIAENRLFEDDTRIQGILIHYMVRRNKVDIMFYFPYRAGISVRLTEEEIDSMLTIFSEIPKRVEKMQNAFT